MLGDVGVGDVDLGFLFGSGVGGAEMGGAAPLEVLLLGLFDFSGDGGEDAGGADGELESELGGGLEGFGEEDAIVLGFA